MVLIIVVTWLMYFWGKFLVLYGKHFGYYRYQMCYFAVAYLENGGSAFVRWRRTSMVDNGRRTVKVLGRVSGGPQRDAVRYCPESEKSMSIIFIWKTRRVLVSTELVCRIRLCLRSGNIIPVFPWNCIEIFQVRQCVLGKQSSPVICSTELSLRRSPEVEWFR